MGYYELGLNTVAAATGAAYISGIGATTIAARMREMGFFCNAATASPVWIARPGNTAALTGPTVGSAVDSDTDPVSLTGWAAAWGTAPTTPTVIYRRVSLPAVIGAGYVAVWNPGEEIVLSKTAGANQQLCLWNPTGGSTGSILSWYAKWAE